MTAAAYKLWVTDYTNSVGFLVSTRNSSPPVLRPMCGCSSLNLLNVGNKFKALEVAGWPEQCNLRQSGRGFAPAVIMTHFKTHPDKLTN